MPNFVQAQDRQIRKAIWLQMSVVPRLTGSVFKVLISSKDLLNSTGNYTQYLVMENNLEKNM